MVSFQTYFSTAVSFLRYLLFLASASQFLQVPSASLVAASPRAFQSGGPRLSPELCFPLPWCHPLVTSSHPKALSSSSWWLPDWQLRACLLSSSHWGISCPLDMVIHWTPNIPPNLLHPKPFPFHSMTALPFQLLRWEHPVISPLFLSQSRLNPSGNYSSSSLKIYPEPDHFSPPPLHSISVQCPSPPAWTSAEVFLLTPLPLTVARVVLLKRELEQGPLHLRTLQKPPVRQHSTGPKAL